MQKIVITGNMGYIGSVVTTHFRAKFPQAELIGYDSGLFATNLSSPGPLPEVALSAQHFGDIRDLPAALLDDVDAVVHLAAVSNDPIGDRFSMVTDEINHRASLRLADLARERGVRNFVFASSCSIYGVSAEESARNESDAVNPQTAYARSKIDTERGLRASNSGEMVTSCLRFATACGFSPRLRLDLVLNDFVASAMATGKIEVLSDGSPWRPLIDVSDMARAIEWAAGRRQDNGGRLLVVNVGSNDWNYRVRDLASAVASELPGVGVSVNRNAAPDTRSYKVDFALFKRLAPDYLPQVDLAETVRRLNVGLLAMGFADEAFRSSGFIRLRVIENLIAQGRLAPDLRWANNGVAQ
jgi:nucleoside-diphosphate-sugar epimerase